MQSHLKLSLYYCVYILSLVEYEGKRLRISSDEILQISQELEFYAPNKLSLFCFVCFDLTFALRSFVPHSYKLNLDTHNASRDVR